MRHPHEVAVNTGLVRVARVNDEHAHHAERYLQRLVAVRVIHLRPVLPQGKLVGEGLAGFDVWGG